MFQFESPGMRDILRRYQPDRIEDLVALNALYRPGPMGMIDDFIDRKHGRKEVVYDLPEMKEILEETYGVMVYQEQVMQISESPGRLYAGRSRSAAPRHGQEESRGDGQAARAICRRRARPTAIPPRKVEKIFDLMEKFAGYGFPKAHSAAYAYLAFVTAYLKTHYPVEFMSALLTSQTGNTAQVVKYINECREMGIRVLPPDVNSSEFDFHARTGDAAFASAWARSRTSARTRWNRLSQARADERRLHARSTISASASIWARSTAG